MRTKVISGLTFAAVFLLLSSVHAADNYKIDPAHTSLTFSVRHMGINNVKGHFDEFSGSIVLDKGEIKEANGTIQVKSINTGVKQRDDHLRTPDFFDAATYPVITFKTKKVEKSGDTTVLVADYTMRGVTKELRLPVKMSGPIKDPQGNIRIGLEAKTNLNRKDYGINYSGVLESGAALVGEDVALEINAEAIKEKTP
ncbi:MAG: YceI family protein [Syntrophobacteraceae bacterium]